MNHLVKRLRKKAGLTQVELAAKTGLAQSYISALEAGVRRAPSLDTLRRLAKALNVKVTELID